MFTGVIRDLGKIVSLKRSDSNVWELQVQSSVFENCKIGDSIAINGCCLTIVKLEHHIATFTLMVETLRRTTFSQKSNNERVHVERSATENDLIDGHPISGHVSGVIVLENKTYSSDGSLILRFRLPQAPMYLTYKGSVAIDGVSLTVSNLSSDSFEVSLIPYTQEVTLLSQGFIGSSYNVEFFCSSSRTLKDGSVLDNENSIQCPLPEYPDLMGLALKKSLLGRITAPSNPWVGCVITDAFGNIVSTGYHRKRGEKHAEVDALSKLIGYNLKDHILYCTLEPCNHTGLQPPCTKAIIESGIRKVIVGILDPDERVAGSGVKRLQDEGIQVTVLHDERITKSLKPYIIHRRTKRPYVIAKMAMSMDGKIAPTGSSQFPISCPEAREHSHILRLKSQAILIGTKTAVLDQPQLNVRLSQTWSKYYFASQEHRPLRCFIDVYGKVTSGPLLNTQLGQTIVFTNKDTCSPSTISIWKQCDVQMCFVNIQDHRICLTDILDDLGKRGVLSLLVEGGGELFTSFVESNLVDCIKLYIAPKFLGPTGVPLYSGNLLTDRYRQVKSKTVGDNTIITYERT